jgi:hypothetical protein
MNNASFQQPALPIKCKHAIVRPVQKSRCWTRLIQVHIDQSQTSALYLRSSRKSWTLGFLSSHTSKQNLLPVFQSSYRPFHSTETAAICVVDSMLKARDQGHVGAFTLLDFSAAFDTVDHQILDDVMRRRFGVCRSALDWLDDFLKTERRPSEWVVVNRPFRN